MSDDEKGEDGRTADEPEELKDEEFVIRDDGDRELDPFYEDMGCLRILEDMDVNLSQWEISGNRYSLDVIDHTARGYLSACKMQCEDPAVIGKIETILGRAE